MSNFCFQVENTSISKSKTQSTKLLRNSRAILSVALQAGEIELYPTSICITSTIVLVMQIYLLIHLSNRSNLSNWSNRSNGSNWSNRSNGSNWANWSNGSNWVICLVLLYLAFFGILFLVDIFSGLNKNKNFLIVLGKNYYEYY